MDMEPPSSSSATISINEVEVEVGTSGENNTKNSPSDVAHCLLSGLYPDDNIIITYKATRLSICKQMMERFPSIERLSVLKARL